MVDVLGMIMTGISWVSDTEDRDADSAEPLANPYSWCDKWVLERWPEAYESYIKFGIPPNW